MTERGEIEKERKRKKERERKERMMKIAIEIWATYLRHGLSICWRLTAQASSTAVCERSSKVVSFFDFPGHEKVGYCNNTIYIYIYICI